MRVLAPFLAALTLVASRQSQKQQISRAIELLQLGLAESFTKHSHIDDVEASIAKFASNLRVRTELADAALRSAKSRLEDLFKSRKEALRRIVKAAETAADAYIPGIEDLAGTSEEDDSPCSALQSRMRIIDVHFHNTETDYNRSGIHINIESYTCDPFVIRDFHWTGTAGLEKTFIDNAAKDPSLSYQYIGTYAGMTRMYPSRFWELYPPSITFDLYDPRFRPWFTQAETPPKDVVFLIDFSGSMKGPTMHLTKILIMYILSTLGPNDYFYGMWFNVNSSSILPCPDYTFIPATTANKKVFFETLPTIDEKEPADLGPPLKFSLDILRDTMNSEAWPKSARSGGEKMILFFTDGIDEWPGAIIEEEIINSDKERVRIFGYAVGFGTGNLTYVRDLACLTNGSHALVDSISDVKSQGRAHLTHLARITGHRVRKRRERPVVYTPLYHDAQGSGPVISLSSPVAVQRKPIWPEAETMAGVAGVDVNVNEITQTLPTGSQLYGFVVDNNGVLLYHPELQIPKTEVHAVRRSACYDASSIKSKAGAGLKVQYGQSDERVFRLVGLIDSIPTIDMEDVEADSATLRQAIVHKSCTEQAAIVVGAKSYLCTEIRGTPFSLVIVDVDGARTLSLSSTAADDSARPNISSSTVGTIVTDKELCAWTINQKPIDMRAAYFLEDSACRKEPKRDTTLAAISAFQPWLESWSGHNISEPDNETVSDFPLQILADDLPAEHFVASLIHSRFSFAFFFPKTASKTMKLLTPQLHREALKTKDCDILKFEKLKKEKEDREIVEDFVISKCILDRKGNKIATVSVVYHASYMFHLFNMSGFPEDVLIVSQDGWVLGPEERPRHLSEIDPQLVYMMKKRKMLAITKRIDVQSECDARGAAPWASRSARSSNPLKALVDVVIRLISSTLWLDLVSSLLHPISAQPAMSSDGRCYFQKTKAYERCAIEITEFELNITKEDQNDLQYGGCTRYLDAHKVPGTNLFVLRLDKGCDSVETPEHYSAEPRRLSSCEMLSSRLRRPPVLHFPADSEDGLVQDEYCLSRAVAKPFTSFVLSLISSSVIARYC